MRDDKAQKRLPIDPDGRITAPGRVDAIETLRGVVNVDVLQALQAAEDHILQLERMNDRAWQEAARLQRQVDAVVRALSATERQD